ncbi:MAG TPA: hypothetical protein VI386_21380 [Candidatus Sulfotelmatobacter sp.]
MEIFLSGAIAALLTFFDIARTFYIPAGKRRFYFLLWAFAFLLANGALACLLYQTVKGLPSIASLSPYLRATLVGASYLVLVRSKLATIKVQNEEVPLGLEYVYNGAKEFVYKGMNRISIAGLTDEAAALAQQQTLKQLASTVSAYITNNNLLAEQDKTARRAWLLKILQDATAEDDKKTTLATYILSERM